MEASVDRATTQREWYQQYYDKAGAERNNLRTNPGVLFQILALEAAIVRAMQFVRHEPQSAQVLDVGCGGGGDIHHLLGLGYDPANITGLDIQEARLAKARQVYPSISFVYGDATRMEFRDGYFDLVFESTMFATLPADPERAAIAAEMVRVCKPGGYLLLVDWRTPKPGDLHYKALTRKELDALFGVGTTTRLLGIRRGALLPPVGRFLSSHASWVYFLVSQLFPFLVGQVAYVLKKTGAEGPVTK